MAMPSLLVPLGVEQHVVVHHHVVAEADLVRMAERHAPAEGDVAANAAEDERVGKLAKEQAEGARNPGGQKDDEFVEDQGADAGPPDDQVAVAGCGRTRGRPVRFLDARFAAQVCCHQDFAVNLPVL